MELKKGTGSLQSSFFLPKSSVGEIHGNGANVTPLKRLQEQNETIRAQNESIRQLSFPSTPSPGGKGLVKALATDSDGSTQGVILISPTHAQRSRSRPMTRPVTVDVSVSTADVAKPTVDLTQLVEKVVENVVGSHNYVGDTLKTMYQDKLDLQKNLYKMESSTELTKLRLAFEKDEELVQNNRQLQKQQVAVEHEWFTREQALHRQYSEEMNQTKNKFSMDLDSLRSKLIQQDLAVQTQSSQQTQVLREEMYKELVSNRDELKLACEEKLLIEQQKVLEIRLLLDSQEREWRMERVELEKTAQNKITELGRQIHELRQQHSEEQGTTILQASQREKSLVLKYEDELQQLRLEGKAREKEQTERLAGDALSSTISMQTMESSLQKQVSGLEQQLRTQEVKMKNLIEEKEEQNRDLLVSKQSNILQEEAKEKLIAQCETNAQIVSSLTIELATEKENSSQIAAKVKLQSTHIFHLKNAIMQDNKLRLLLSKHRTYERSNLAPLETVCENEKALDSYILQQQLRVEELTISLEEKGISLCCDRCVCHCVCQTHQYNAGCQTEYSELVLETGTRHKGSLQKFSHDAETQTTLRLTDDEVPINKKLLCGTCSIRVDRLERGLLDIDQSILIFNTALFLGFFDSIIATYSTVREALQNEVALQYEVTAASSASYSVLSNIVMCDKILLTCTELRPHLEHAVVNHKCLESDIVKQITTQLTIVNEHISSFSRELTGGVAEGISCCHADMTVLKGKNQELVTDNTMLTTTINDLQIRVSNQENTIAIVRKEQEKMQSMVKETESTLENTLGELDNAKRQVRLQNEQVKARDAHLQQVLEHQQTLNADLDQTNQALILESRKVASLMLGLDGDKSEMAGQAHTVAKLEERKQQLEGALEVLEEKNKEKDIKIRNYERIHEELNTVHATYARVAEEKTAQLQTQLQQQSDKLVVTEAGLHSSEEQLYDYKTRLASVEQQVDGLLRRVSTGEAKLDQTTVKYKKLRKAYEEAKKFITQTKADALKVYEDKTKLSDQCKQIIVLYDDFIQRQSKEMDDFAALFGVSRSSIVPSDYEEEEKECVVAANFGEIPSLDLDDNDSTANESMLQQSTCSSLHSQLSNPQASFLDIVQTMQQFCANKQRELVQCEKINSIFMTSLKSTLERVCLAMEEFQEEKPAMEIRMRQLQELAGEFGYIKDMNKQMDVDLKRCSSEISHLKKQNDSISELKHDQEHDNTRLVAELGECMRLNSILNEEKINLAEIAELARSEVRVCRDMLKRVKSIPSGCHCECNCCEYKDVMLDDDCRPHYEQDYIPLVPSTECKLYTNMAAKEQDQYTFDSSSSGTSLKNHSNSSCKTTKSSKMQQHTAKIQVLEEYILSLEQGLEDKLHLQLTTLTSTYDKEYAIKLERQVAEQCLRVQERYEIEICDKIQQIQTLEKQLLLTEKSQNNKLKLERMDVEQAERGQNEQKDEMEKLSIEMRNMQIHHLDEIGRLKANYDDNQRLQVQYHQEDLIALENRLGKNIKKYESEFKTQLIQWKSAWQDKQATLENPITQARALSEQLEKMEHWVESMVDCTKKEVEIDKDDEKVDLLSSSVSTPGQLSLSCAELLAQIPPSIQLYLGLSCLSVVLRMVYKALHTSSSLPEMTPPASEDPLFQTQTFSKLSSTTRLALNHMATLTKQLKNLGTSNAVIREACKPYMSAVLTLDADCNPVIVKPPNKSILPAEALLYCENCVHIDYNALSCEAQYVRKLDTSADDQLPCCYPQQCLYHWHELPSVPISPVFIPQQGTLAVSDQATLLSLPCLLENIQGHVKSGNDIKDLTSKMQMLLHPLISNPVNISALPIITYESLFTQNSSSSQEHIFQPVVKHFANSLLKPLLRSKQHSKSIEKTVQTVVTTLAPKK